VAIKQTQQQYRGFVRLRFATLILELAALRAG
jgi:hypothetical protein